MIRNSIFTVFFKVIPYKSESYLVKPKAGITLVELLLMVSILAIISAVGLPTVWQNMGKRADMKTVQGLASDIENVRSMALMDLRGFSNAVFKAGESKYDVATKTKELTGNYLIKEAHNFHFKQDGTLSTGILTTINIRRGINATTIAHVDIASSGLITWSIP